MFNPNALQERWEHLRRVRHAHRGEQQVLQAETDLARLDLDQLESQAAYWDATGPHWRHDEYRAGPDAVRPEHPPHAGDA
jgi:hypothetical protein